MVQRAPIIRYEQSLSFARETATIIDAIKRHFLELVTAPEGTKENAETLKRKRLCMFQSRYHHAVQVLIVQYVSVIAWVFDFRKFITITDVSLKVMYIACTPIASLCSEDGFIHERHTKYLVPWM